MFNINKEINMQNNVLKLDSLVQVVGGTKTVWPIPKNPMIPIIVKPRPYPPIPYPMPKPKPTGPSKPIILEPIKQPLPQPYLERAHSFFSLCA